MPRLVRQLSALLGSGRSGPALWAALADVLAIEQRPLKKRRQRENPPSRPGRVPERDGLAAGHPGIALVRAVQRASTLGLPTADAVKSACRHGTGPAPGPGLRPRAGALSRAQVQVWLELAACFEFCEASGAPVAAVLSRLADRLEVEQDTAALREGALAGPRATVRLLSWLPFVGLGLGIAMGVDPLGVLLGSPFGWGCLGTGLMLAAAGRWWSHRLISTAAHTPSHTGARAAIAAGSRRVRRRTTAATRSSDRPGSGVRT